MSKIDDLIAATLAAGPGQKGCFAVRLEGDAAAYLKGMTEAERSGKYGKVHRAETRRNLIALGVRISEERLRNHLIGSCSCPS